jgi:hypothetical protein
MHDHTDAASTGRPGQAKRTLRGNMRVIAAGTSPSILPFGIRCYLTCQGGEGWSEDLTASGSSSSKSLPIIHRAVTGDPDRSSERKQARQCVM